jgi:DNA polymerase-3 subunit gamma/tau
VVEIDAASNRGVDDARELRERAMYAASAPGRFKVYIIDEAHMLTREAWNALLKILEEPPPSVVFVFATTEPQKIANTAAPVLSRVQRFDFRRIGPQATVERMQFVARAEDLDVEEDALRLIARVAAGGMRDALSLLDQALAFGEGAITAARVRDALGLIDDELYAELLDIVVERRTADVFPFVARLVEAGADLVEFVNGAGDVLRALLLRILAGEPEGLTEGLRTAVERHAERLREGDVLRMLRLLAETETAIRRSPNVRLYVEVLLTQWSLLDRTVELAALFDAVGSGRLPTPPDASPPAPPRRAPPAPRAAPPVEHPTPPSERAAPTRAGPLTLDGLRAAWPAVLEEVGRRSHVTKATLAQAAQPLSADGVNVVLAVSDSGGLLEGLRQYDTVIAEAIRQATGADVRVTCRAAGADTERTPPASPQRLDRDRDREERLRGYRAKDPTLDVVAEAMDLELLD